MKEEAMKLFCFVVKRTETGLSIEEALASLLLRLVKLRQLLLLWIQKESRIRANFRLITRPVGCIEIVEDHRSFVDLGAKLF